MEFILSGSECIHTSMSVLALDIPPQLQVNSIHNTFSDRFQNAIPGTYERSMSCDKSQSSPHHVSAQVRSNLGGSPANTRKSSDEIDIEPHILAVPRWMAHFVFYHMVGRKHDACGPFLVRANGITPPRILYH